MRKGAIVLGALACLARPAFSETDLEARRLIREGAYARAERAAREHLAEVETRAAATEPERAEALDLAAEAAWRNWSVSPDSLELAERALEARRRLAGANDPKLATSLFNLARVAARREDHARARPLDEQALAIREASLRPDDPAIVLSLSYQAQYLAMRFGEIERAGVLLRRALAISERRGFDDPSAAVVLRLSGDLAAVATRFDEAEGHYRRCVGMSESVLPPAHGDRGLCWSNLGNTLSNHGDPIAGQAALETALRVWEQAFGADHPATATALVNLARSVSDVESDDTRAVAYLRRAIRTFETVYGPDHGLVVDTLSVLAGVLGTIRETDEALDALERAASIQERRGGADPPNYEVVVPIPLGILLMQLGDLDGAERWLRRALDSARERYGDSHRWAWAARVNLAELSERRGNWNEALRDYEQVVDGARAAGVDEGEETATHALHGLGRAVWRVRSDRQQALTLHQRALAIRERTFGPWHPEVAESLENLGAFWLEAGEVAASRRALERALGIRIRRHGALHPDTAACRLLLASTLAAAGEKSAALGQALEAERGSRRHLRLLADGVSEDQALRYAASRPSGLDAALTLIRGFQSSPAARRQVLDEVIRSRAIVFDAMAARAEGVHEAARGDTAKERAEYTEATARLAHLIVRGPGERPEGEYRELLRTARVRQVKAERELLAASPEFHTRRKAAEVGFANVAATLRADQVLVSVVRYGRGEPKVQAYAAFVTRRDGPPAFIDLGEARVLDELVAAWRREASHRPESSPTALETYRRAAIPLRRAVWDPIAAAARGAREFLFVPDGALHAVNLDVLPDDSGRYLVESGVRVSVFSAERDTVGQPAAGIAGELLAVGGVDFEAEGAQAAVGPNAAARGAPPSCRDLRGIRFAPLPGTAEEVARVASLWGSDHARRLVGAEASERAFKVAAVGAGAVHLATHGVFLSGDCNHRNAAHGERGAGTLVGESAPFDRAKPTIENPLRLAALAFAGANRFREAIASAEDGILTMEEVAALDLSAARWVVLSACDTAVGDVLDSEGVLGLRRAFRTAGAGAVVASLWAVDDRATTDWMTELYRARTKARDVSDAVRQASLAILRARRAAGLDDHPFWWGGFVGGR